MVKKKSAVVAWAMGCVGAILLAGCESESIDNQGTVSLAELQGLAVPTAPTDTGTTTSTGTNTVDASYPAEIDGPIHWLHTNVSSWPVTSSLHASVGSTISFPYSKANVWPAVDGVNANPWVIVKWTDGKWYAATFEWLRKGQTSKPKGVLDGSMGDHIKVSPLNKWRPHSGERFGIMVSGLARTQTRNVKERTNISMVTWP